MVAGGVKCRGWRGLQGEPQKVRGWCRKKQVLGIGGGGCQPSAGRSRGGGVFQPPAAAALGLSLSALHYREPHHVLHAGLPWSPGWLMPREGAEASWNQPCQAQRPLPSQTAALSPIPSHSISFPLTRPLGPPPGHLHHSSLVLASQGTGLPSLPPPSSDGPLSRPVLREGPGMSCSVQHAPGSRSPDGLLGMVLGWQWPVLQMRGWAWGRRDCL